MLTLKAKVFRIRIVRMTDYVPAKKGKKKDAKDLIKLRKRLNWTQRDAAEEFYVSPGTIALWETGKRKMPGPAIRLLEILNER